MTYYQTYQEFVNESGEQLSLWPTDMITKSVYGDDNVRVQVENQLLSQLSKKIDLEIKATYPGFKWKYRKKPTRVTWNDSHNGAWINVSLNLSGRGKWAGNQTIEMFGKWVIDGGDHDDGDYFELNVNGSPAIKKQTVESLKKLFMSLKWSDIKDIHTTKDLPNWPRVKDVPSVWMRAIQADPVLKILVPEMPLADDMEEGAEQALMATWSMYIKEYKKKNRRGLSSFF